MEKLVSSWSDGKILPESYIFPPEIRPGQHNIPISKNVPVIDLGKAEGDDRTKIVQQIIEAAQEFGFFQVINHGVPRRLMDDTREVLKEFFELPPDQEKSELLSMDMGRKCILLTSNVDYDKEETHNWRDTLRLACTPLEECMKSWPQQPTRYREVVGEYTVEVRALGSRILELICEGLGTESGYFSKELSQEQVMAVHHYPPCPDPSLTVGTRKHCDPGLLTLLLQGSVLGLQVLKDGEWIGVEAIPDAFVINIGQQLQIVSNNKLVSAEHRAVTNKDEARITAAFFIEPTKDCLVESAKGVVTAENPRVYKCVQYGDFLKTFRAAYVGEIDNVLEAYHL